MKKDSQKLAPALDKMYDLAMESIPKASLEERLSEVKDREYETSEGPADYIFFRNGEAIAAVDSYGERRAEGS